MTTAASLSSAAARSLLDAAGAPPDALDPLIRGVVDGGFELTGPIARGDWETVERHLEVIRAERPELEGALLQLLGVEGGRVRERDTLYGFFSPAKTDRTAAAN